jgi:hypothetical protein
VLPAQQQREQIVGGGVVADQLRSYAFGVQEHVDGGRVVALLSVGPSKVEADLTPAARQACRKTLKLEAVAGFHRGVGVAGRYGGRDLVDANIRWAEGGPVIVAILAESIGGVLGLGEGAAGGGAVELGRGCERIGQMQAADDRQPFWIIAPG